VHKGNIQKIHEGGFRDWAMNWRARIPFADNHRARNLDHRQSGQESRRSPSSQNAAMIEPGLEQAPDAFKRRSMRGESRYSTRFTRPTAQGSGSRN